MKRVHLLINDLKTIITHKTVFSFFVTSMLISAILFIYLYGNSVVYMTSRNKKSDVGFRTYECVVLEDSKVDLSINIMEEVENCFSDFPVESA